MAFLSSLSGLGQNRRNRGLAHGTKTSCRGQGLLQDALRVASRDYYAGREVHRVVQAFDRARRVALQDDFISHRLHA